MFQDEEENAYTSTPISENYTILFDNVFEYHHKGNFTYLDEVKKELGKAELKEDMKLIYDSDSAEWSAGEKAFMDQWKIRVRDADEDVENIVKTIRKTRPNKKIGKILARSKNIYLGKFTYEDTEYPVAIYGNGTSTKIEKVLTKVQVLDSDVLEEKDSIKHIYCDETYVDYMIIGFYEENKEDPTLIMQIEKFDISNWQNTKDKWLEYLGILKKETNNLESDTIKIFITRTNTGTNSTTGTLTTDDGSITGYTVELPRGSDNECKTSCTDNTIPYNCHCIVEGTYAFEINTKVYSKASKQYLTNNSLRIISNIPNGRTGVLLHGGQDNAKGYSQGCILPMENQPVLNLSHAGRFVNSVDVRNNTKESSHEFTISIVDWVREREAEIKKNNEELENVVKQIIITKTF